MIYIQKQTIKPIAFSLFVALFFLSSSTMAEDKAVTNADVYQLLGKSSDFKKSHSIMQQQHTKLVSILDSFLIGDAKSINSKLDEFLTALDQLILTPLQNQENKSNILKVKADIVEEARLIKKAALKNDYTKAFEHFTNITNSCIQCHQVARQWGKLPEFAPSYKEDAKSDSK